jgi:WD40 repeat protein
MLCILQIGLLIFGIVLLVKGELNFSRTRRIQSGAARLIGIILMLPLLGGFGFGVVHGFLHASQQRHYDPQEHVVLYALVELGLLGGCGVLALFIALLGLETVPEVRRRFTGEEPRSDPQPSAESAPRKDAGSEQIRTTPAAEPAALPKNVTELPTALPVLEAPATAPPSAPVAATPARSGQNPLLWWVLGGVIASMLLLGLIFLVVIVIGVVVATRPTDERLLTEREIAREQAEVARVQKQQAERRAADAERERRDAALAANKARDDARIAADKLDAEKRAASLEQRRADYARYIGAIARAQQQFTEKNAPQAARILDETPAELRGWEWHYLRGLSGGGEMTLASPALNARDVQVPGNFRCLAASANGKFLGAVTEHGIVRVWDATTGKEVRTWTPKSRWESLAFSPDGKQVYDISLNHFIEGWETESGRELFSVKEEKDQPLVTIAASPDGKYLATATHNTGVTLREAATGKAVRTVVGGHTCVVFSSDSKRLVAGYRGAVAQWDVATGGLTTLRDLGKPPRTVAISPDGKQMAAGGEGPNVVLATHGGVARMLTLPNHWIYSLAFSPDGSYLATASGGRDEGTIKLWDARTGAEKRTLLGPTGIVRSLVFLPDGRLASAGDESDHKGLVRIWDLNSQGGAIVLKGKFTDLSELAFGPDNRSLAVAGNGHEIVIWDVDNPRAQPRSIRSTGMTRCVAWSPDASRIAFPGESGVMLWDLGKNQRAGDIAGGHKLSTINAVAFNSDGKRLATASSDGTARVWNLADGGEVAQVRNQLRGCSGLVFSDDGTMLAVATDEDTVSTRSADTGDVLRSFKVPGARLQKVALSKNGNRLAAVGYADQRRAAIARIWNLKDGAEAPPLTGHVGEVTALAFSPDGKRLATGGKDRNIRLWDVETGQETLLLKGHLWPLRAVAFSRDGRRLASGDSSGEVRIWEARGAP